MRNDYCRTLHDNEVLLAQAQWLVEHEIRIDASSGGWPISSPQSAGSNAGLCLSAVIQGCAITTLVHAYTLTHEELFFETMKRAVKTFERDILDAGVNTPVGNQGIYFEEVAVYPATHSLSGCISGLLGLYAYVALTHDEHIQALIKQALAGLHLFLPEFDTGFWTYSDLLHRHISSPEQFALQIDLLNTLSNYSHCTHCSHLVARWKKYQRQPENYIRRFAIECWSSCRASLWRPIQSTLFPKASSSIPLRTCISVPAFPAPGGVFTVLEGIAHVMKDIWDIEYLTHQVGPHSEKYVIHRFGTKKMAYWQFPMVWLHVAAGCRKFLSLMRHGAHYQVILPQDGVFSGALAAIAGKLSGVRVVCIDHGHLTLLKSQAYRAERIKMLAQRVWYRRFLSRVLYIFYWPSLSLLALIAGRLTDYYLVPGIAGDGVEEACQQLGIPSSHLVRFASMIHVEDHSVLDLTTRAALRREKNLSPDAMIVAIVCRLAPEKGLEVALESIQLARAQLPLPLREQLHVVIAGDGPLRTQMERDVDRLGLTQTCTFWGEISQREVFSLLSISDIFLYTSTRGACFPMAVLEAMASSCAVIASTQPMSNSHLLAEGRGITVQTGNVEETCSALTQLASNVERCRRMGQLSRAYIQEHHSPETFKRTLQRATYWPGLSKRGIDEKTLKAFPFEGVMQ